MDPDLNKVFILLVPAPLKVTHSEFGYPSFKSTSIPKITISVSLAHY
jgi:hypothetical protein